jgi:ATP-dependent RNA helicase DHX8/PRP22
MSLAKRVAEEQGVSLGAEVGYKFRFCDRTSSQTLIKYCTEGTLIREFLNSNQLNNHSVIIMDEAHERTTNIDVLFGYLKRNMTKCPNLRIIVSSATLEAEKFSKFFSNDTPVFHIQGRTFPVEMFYRTADVNDYFNASISTAIYIHKTQKSGDILMFLTGQDEIENAYEAFEGLQAQGTLKDLHVLKIFSALPFAEQIKVFDSTPEGSRKLIISTNVSETSMTIPGVYFVIDAGYSKLKMFNPKAGLEVLDIMPISQASADQRAGRAGRTGPGKCYRLYTKKSYDTMLKATIPEIQRSNLESIVLQFKAMGIVDVSNFEFLDPPSKESIFMAEKKLFGLRALDDKGYITDMGRRMVDFPLDPMLSKMLIVSIDLKCSSEIITIIAMMSAPNVFYRPKKKANVADQKRQEMCSPISDHITLLNAYNLWERNEFSSDWCYNHYINERSMNEAWETREMLLEKMEMAKIEVTSAGKNLERIQKALCAGFAQNIARKNPRGFSYKIIQGEKADVYIHPSSSVMKTGPQW